VLGSLLFLLYINNLSTKVFSSIRLYADDVILYRNINSEEDILILQRDLFTIAHWAQELLMLLDISKCEHLTITTKGNPTKSTYKPNDQTLCQVNSAKYLGVAITQTLSWHDHIINICNKANSAHAFLQQNLRNCSPSVKPLAYSTYVKPTVELCLCCVVTLH